MKELRLVLLGFGSANQALAQMLLDKSVQDEECRRCLRITQCFDGAFTTKLIPWKIVCIITRRHGCVSVAEGQINVEDALGRIVNGEMLDDSLIVQNHPNENAQSIPLLTNSSTATAIDETIKLIDRLGKTQTANILVEAISSNPKSDGEPAISFLKTALHAGMHVASANKCPLAHKRNDKETYVEIQEIAKQNGRLYLHESAVMDGVPLFSLWSHALPNITCTKIRGLLNSTTTMIVSRMEGNIDQVVESGDKIEYVGETFEEALEAAKQMGIVEEDETLDIDGWDAAMKLRALCVFLSSSTQLSSSATCDTIIPPLEDVKRDSIRRIDQEQIVSEFRRSRMKMRSVAFAELTVLPPIATKGQHQHQHNTTYSWKMSVENELLSPNDPLYNLNGTSSSVQFCTDVMGPITVVSSDPTLSDTAYGLFADLVRIASQS